MTALEEARAYFEAGAFGRAHEAAVAGLERAPDDVELLRLAGRAGVEVGSGDAVERLRRVTELQPDSAEAWRDLADALSAEGRTAEASDAFRKVLESEPEDEAALTALGHTAFQEGKRDDAVSMLEQVAGRGRGGSSAAISLVDMYRTLGQPDNALAAARRVAEADADSPLAALDVAELALETGHLDEAADAFARLRELLELPDGQVAALQGAIKVELARGQPERALELARQASAIDSVGRTAGVLAHLEVELGADETPYDAIARGATTVFIQAQELPPSRTDVDWLLDATLAELRRGLLGEEGRGASGGGSG
ncbi:MAG: tetratricopeptide repeat protein [Thermoleophilaceae bacterium]